MLSTSIVTLLKYLHRIVSSWFSWACSYLWPHCSGYPFPITPEAHTFLFTFIRTSYNTKVFELKLSKLDLGERHHLWTIQLHTIGLRVYCHQNRPELRDDTQVDSLGNSKRRILETWFERFYASRLYLFHKLRCKECNAMAPMTCSECFVPILEQILVSHWDYNLSYHKFCAQARISNSDFRFKLERLPSWLTWSL